jgi:hypothetical protein
MKVKKMNDDTEVREIENERADAVRQMMDQWKDGNLTDAQDTFDTMMNQRADELVAGRKAEVAATMFNTEVEDEEVELEVEVEDEPAAESDTESEETSEEESEEE